MRTTILDDGGRHCNGLDIARLFVDLLGGGICLLASEVSDTLLEVAIEGHELFLGKVFVAFDHVVHGVADLVVEGALCLRVHRKVVAEFVDQQPGDLVAL